VAPEIRSSSHIDTNVAIVGAGPAGLCAALALARSEVEVILIAAPHKPAGDRPDTRTAALFNPAIVLLQNLGVWDYCRQYSAELKAIRLLDDTGDLLRAPEVIFKATEIGQPVFGFNVPQEPLVHALHRAARQRPSLRIIESQGVRQVTPGGSDATLHLAEGQTLRAQLVVAADGRRSITREAAGITTHTKKCGQTAVTCTFAHTRDHAGISSELHRRAGPMTVVPMPGRYASLVWVERPQVAQRLFEMTEANFTRVLEENLHGLLGSVSEIGPRATFPLSHMTSSCMARNRVALVGEAGHAMPPIGAQGLNLSLRDVAHLADLVLDASNNDRDTGAQSVLEQFNTLRMPDARNRAFAVNTLNQALLSEFVPVQLGRAVGMHFIKAIRPLRQQLMKIGMAPTTPFPALMRPADTSI
jgi:2-octaprenyl-6-methoxyphenol hydroxylase